MQVNVYRKPTHTNKYLDINSHHPMNNKQSVVNMLLDRADKIPPSKAGKRKERKRVMVLKDNDYPSKFIKNCNSKRNLPLLSVLRSIIVITT